jgi:serine protease Do
MSSSLSSRLKYGGAVAIAFACGLVFASGFDLTRFGYAQQSRASVVRTANSVAAPASVAELNNSFVGISERVTPAVVSITAERTEQPRAQQRNRRQQQPGGPPGLEDFFRQFDPREQAPMEASGSGFIVSPDGFILTNNHVVADFDRVNVTLTDHRSFRAKVIGRDSTTDVAVIKIEGSNLPVATLGADEALQVGEWVLAIGNPLGLDFTVTAGIVSAKGRGSNDLPDLNRNQYSISDFIQTDAAINPGNSGGPLVNIRGEVIGINSAIATRTGYYQGYGFAIPVSLAKDVMDDLVKYGRVRRAVIGVTIGEMTPELAASAGLKEIRGVVVSDYSGPDSPARKAGLLQGDVILKADGKVADRVSTLQRIIRSHEPGETVELEVFRDGQRKTFRLKLAEAPSDPARVARVERGDDAESPTSRPTATTASKLGITVEPVTPDFAREANIPEDQRGLRVISIDPSSGARGRIDPTGRDVIVGVIYPGPRRPIRTTTDLQNLLSKVEDGDSVTLVVYNVQGQNTRVVAIKVGER